MKSSLHVFICFTLLTIICITFATRAYVMDANDSREPTSHISIEGVDQRELHQELYEYAAKNGYQPRASARNLIGSLICFTPSAKADDYNRKVQKFLTDYHMAPLAGAEVDSTLCVTTYDQRYGAGKESISNFDIKQLFCKYLVLVFANLAPIHY